MGILTASADVTRAWHLILLYHVKVVPISTCKRAWSRL